MSNTPNRGIPYVPENVLDPAAGTNVALNTIDALLQCRVISMSETSPPASNSDGDLYIVASTATGAWAGYEDYLARYVAEGAFWQFYLPGENVNYVLNAEDNGLYSYSQSSPVGWFPALPGAAVAASQVSWSPGASPTTPTSPLPTTAQEAIDDIYQLIVALFSAGAVPTGTSFPLSPSVDDRFYRTDRHIEYFYDGTRWLSTQLFTLGIDTQDALNAITFTDRRNETYPWSGLYDIYVERFLFASTMSTTTATNYFTAQLEYSVGATTTNVGSALSNQNNTQNQYVIEIGTIDSVIPSNAVSINILFTEAGTASGYLQGAINYRLVG